MKLFFLTRALFWKPFYFVLNHYFNKKISTINIHFLLIKLEKNPWINSSLSNVLEKTKQRTWKPFLTVVDQKNMSKHVLSVSFFFIISWDLSNLLFDVVAFLFYLFVFLLIFVLCVDYYYVDDITRFTR